MSGSGGSYSESYDRLREVSRGFTSGSPEERRLAEARRRMRVEAERASAARATADAAEAARKASNEPGRDTEGLYREDLVRLGITRPDAHAKAVWMLLVDNSGSNRKIAEGLRKRTGYLAATLEAVDPSAQYCMDFFSDHDDDARQRQPIDYVYPKDADGVWYSSCRHIGPASGGDFPEAIECELKYLTELDFGAVSERHLVLVTDSIPHGMGQGDFQDDGCPFNVDWRKSVARVREVFTSFTIIGCGASAMVAEMQKQLLLPERVAHDFVDLSFESELPFRLALTANALLLMVARSKGEQTMEMFFSLLYENWLKTQLFGRETDARARDAIGKLARYSGLTDKDRNALLRRVFAE